MRITILRHGKPVLPASKTIKAAELGAWIDAYDQTGIGGKPPEQALSAAKACKIIVTSDLRRSRDSGRALSSGLEIVSDSLFREAGLPYSPVASFKLPPLFWAGMFRLLWFIGFRNNAESIGEFRDRSRRAASLLITLAREHESVLFIGHGLINRFIAGRLLAAGWKGPAKIPSRHWALSEYIF